MKDLIERLENDIAFAGKGPVVVRARDLRALIAAHKALREAAGALDKALKEEGAEACDICGCGALATRYLGWQIDGEVLCEEHAEEERNDPGNDEPCDDYDLAIAAPLRALRAALKEEP